MSQKQAMPGQGDQCIFCQLIDNPEQLILVGETENFYAWLDVQARSKGHTQVVPKEHVESVLEFSPQEYHEAMTLVREVVEKAKKGLEADGASVTMNIEESAGQMMPHAYISVFPRFEEDENAGTPTGAIFQHREDLQDEGMLNEIQGEMESATVDFGVEKIEPHPESQRFRDDKSSNPEPEEKSEGKEQEKSPEKDDLEKNNVKGKSFEWI